MSAISPRQELMLQSFVRCWTRSWWKDRLEKAEFVQCVRSSSPNALMRSSVRWLWVRQSAVFSCSESVMKSKWQLQLTRPSTRVLWPLPCANNCKQSMERLTWKRELLSSRPKRQNNLTKWLSWNQSLKQSSAATKSAKSRKTRNAQPNLISLSTKRSIYRRSWRPSASPTSETLASETAFKQCSLAASQFNA